MPRPVIRFPDAQLATRDLLRRLLADRDEPEAKGAVVSTKSPKASDATPGLPYVRVRTDQTFRDARLNGRATIRVQVWHRDEGLGVALADLIESLLLSPLGRDSRIRGASSVQGAIPTADSDTGAPMSFLTLTVRLRPTALPERTSP